MPLPCDSVLPLRFLLFFVFVVVLLFYCCFVLHCRHRNGWGNLPWWWSNRIVLFFCFCNKVDWFPKPEFKDNNLTKNGRQRAREGKIQCVQNVRWWIESWKNSFSLLFFILRSVDSICTLFQFFIFIGRTQREGESLSSNWSIFKSKNNNEKKIGRNWI